MMRAESVFGLSSPGTSPAGQIGPKCLGEKFCFVLADSLATQLQVWSCCVLCGLQSLLKKNSALPLCPSSMEKWWKIYFEQMLLFQQSNPWFLRGRWERNKTFCLFSSAHLPQQHWSGAAPAKLHIKCSVLCHIHVYMHVIDMSPYRMDTQNLIFSPFLSFKFFSVWNVATLNNS